MARRANSSINPFWIAMLFVLVAAAIGAGFFLVHRVNDPYRTLAVLDARAYLENSNSLRGNSYKISGGIWNSLDWSAKGGRLFSVEVDSGNSTELLPVLVPVEFNHVNIQKGQRFNFSVEIDEQGILKVKGLTKT